VTKQPTRRKTSTQPRPNAKASETEVKNHHPIIIYLSPKQFSRKTNHKPPNNRKQFATMGHHKEESPAVEMLNKAKDFMVDTVWPFLQFTVWPATKKYSIISFEYSRDVIAPFIKKYSIQGFEFTRDTAVPFVQEKVSGGGAGAPRRSSARQSRYQSSYYSEDEE
jgi:hypothetical protein